MGLDLLLPLVCLPYGQAVRVPPCDSHSLGPYLSMCRPLPRQSQPCPVIAGYSSQRTLTNLAMLSSTFYRDSKVGYYPFSGPLLSLNPTPCTAGQRRLLARGLLRRVLPQVACPARRRVAAVRARAAHILGPELPRGVTGLPFRLCDRDAVYQQGVTICGEGGVGVVTLCSGTGDMGSSRSE